MADERPQLPAPVTPPDAAPLNAADLSIRCVTCGQVIRPAPKLLDGFQHPNPTKNRALRKFVTAGTVTAACEAAGISRRVWYDWMAEDELFRELALQLKEANTDELEEEAVRRATHGSDTLLIFLLKSRRPGIYRDRLTIDVVSPEVTNRLQAQADAILEICPPEIAAKLAERLKEIWVGQ